jgi:phage terminase large subunit-like protein
MAKASKLKARLREAKKQGWAQWIKSEADERAVLHGCYFDEQAANRAAQFFPRFLRHSKGQWAGQPFYLLPWQEEGIIKPLFGWKRPDGYRRYRTAYIEIPKKNGKSTLCAGLALYLLTKDNEPGAEIYSAAADRAQASIVYNEAAAMMKSSPPLRKRLRNIPSQKVITYEATNSFYKVLSADAYTKEGLNIHGLLFDELHAQKTRDLWDTLAYGGAARRQPLLIAITTAGTDRNSICWEQHEYAIKVASGDIEDDTFFPFVLGADEAKDDWEDPEVWKRTNPSLGVTISWESFEADFRAAKESPRKQNAFKRYRLNIWTSTETRWLDMAKWDECAGDPEIPQDEPCYLGLDLSSTTDITSAALFCPKTGAVVSWNWIPEENMDVRERRDKVPFSQWARDGWVTPTPGNVVDYAFIRKTINDIKAQYPGIKVIGYDEWNATQLALQLEQEDGMAVMPIRQGYRTLSPACKELEKMVMEGKLKHGGNPVLRWAINNVVIQADPNDNIRPVKNKATERIDPAVALIIAIAAWQQMQALEEAESVYESRGVLAI